MQNKTIMGRVCTIHAKPNIAVGLTADWQNFEIFPFTSVVYRRRPNGTVFAYYNRVMNGHETGSPTHLRDFPFSFNSLREIKPNGGRE